MRPILFVLLNLFSVLLCANKPKEYPLPITSHFVLPHQNLTNPYSPPAPQKHSFIEPTMAVIDNVPIREAENYLTQTVNLPFCQAKDTNQSNFEELSVKLGPTTTWESIAAGDDTWKKERGINSNNLELCLDPSKHQTWSTQLQKPVFDLAEYFQENFPGTLTFASTLIGQKFFSVRMQNAIKLANTLRTQASLALQNGNVRTHNALEQEAENLLNNANTFKAEALYQTIMADQFIRKYLRNEEHSNISQALNIAVRITAQSVLIFKIYSEASFKTKVLLFSVGALNTLRDLVPEEYTYFPVNDFLEEYSMLPLVLTLGYSLQAGASGTQGKLLAFMNIIQLFAFYSDIKNSKSESGYIKGTLKNNKDSRKAYRVFNGVEISIDGFEDGYTNFQEECSAIPEGNPDPPTWGETTTRQAAYLLAHGMAVSSSLVNAKNLELGRWQNYAFSANGWGNSYNSIRVRHDSQAYGFVALYRTIHHILTAEAFLDHAYYRPNGYDSSLMGDALATITRATLIFMGSLQAGHGRWGAEQARNHAVIGAMMMLLPKTLKTLTASLAGSLAFDWKWNKEHTELIWPGLKEGFASIFKQASYYTSAATSSDTYDFAIHGLKGFYKTLKEGYWTVRGSGVMWDETNKLFNLTRDITEQTRTIYTEYENQKSKAEFEYLIARDSPSLNQTEIVF